MFGTETDEKLIAKALDGSQRSWVKLVSRYEKRVYNHCLRMTFNKDDAMDLMQEVFLAVYRNLPSYQGTGAFGGWLLRIASNKSTDFLRARSRNPLHDAFEVMETDMKSHHGPQEQMLTSRENQQVVNTMAHLPDEQRLIVELKFFQHLTFEEIAKQTGISVNTVKTRLYAALKKLKGHLEVQNAL